MNTTKIAALYGTYSNLHLLSPTDPLHQQVLDLLQAKAQRAAEGILDGNRCHLAIKHMGAPARLSPAGKRLYNEIEIYCSQRVHDWARAQQPATDRHKGLPEGEVWSAMTSAFSADAEGEFSLRFGAKADFAVMLRGVQAYERKQQKHTRKLLAQLKVYHQQQMLLGQQANVVPVVGVATVAAGRAEVQPSRGRVGRFYQRLRCSVVAKIHQVAVAAEAALAAEGSLAA
jgi:hypothetical protein